MNRAQAKATACVVLCAPQAGEHPTHEQAVALVAHPLKGVGAAGLREIIAVLAVSYWRATRGKPSPAATEDAQ